LALALALALAGAFITLRFKQYSTIFFKCLCNDWLNSFL